MKPNKWPDFLFTLVVRFVSGVFIGGLACFVFTWKVVLRGFSHDDIKGPIIWLGLCAFAGGMIAILTVPHWQTPWYKGVVRRDDE